MIPSLTFYLCSSENQIVRVGSRSRRTKPITKHGNVQCDWLILSLLLPTPTIWFSLDHNLNVSNGVVSGVGRNGNILILPTLIPLRLWFCLQTPIFDFHQVISTLATPLTTPTPPPSLVKTSLKVVHFAMLPTLSGTLGRKQFHCQMLCDFKAINKKITLLGQ